MFDNLVETLRKRDYLVYKWKHQRDTSSLTDSMAQIHVLDLVLHDNARVRGQNSSM